MSVDLYLDPETHDFAFDDRGELRLVGGDSIVADMGQTSSDGELVAQRLRYGLRTQRGEWFLDTTYGVDWLGTVFGKGAASRARESAARAEILATVAGAEGVAAVREFDMQLERITRQLNVTFEVSTDDGLLRASGVLPSLEFELL